MQSALEQLQPHGTNAEVSAFFFLREWIQVMLSKIDNVDENEIYVSVYLWITMITEEMYASSLYIYISQMSKDEMLKEMGY